MRTDQDDLGMNARNFRFDIVARLPAHVVTVATRSETSARKRIFDKISSGIELRVMPHVALADFSHQLLYIGAKLFAQRNFIRREQRRFRNIFPRHSHSKTPEERQNCRNRDGNAQSAEENLFEHVTIKLPGGVITESVFGYNLGSARVSRVDFGVAPKQAFHGMRLRTCSGIERKFAIARTRSPARGTRALPD